MLFYSAVSSVLALFPVTRVIGGQVPVVGGVVGGVPASTPLVKLQIQLEAATVAPTTPGKLRGVVENSGICGKFVVNQEHRAIYSSFCFYLRDDSRRISSIWVRRPHIIGKYMVRTWCSQTGTVVLMIHHQVLVLCLSQ
jgi:hypothetical protein